MYHDAVVSAVVEDDMDRRRLARILAIKYGVVARYRTISWLPTRTLVLVYSYGDTVPLPCVTVVSLYSHVLTDDAVRTDDDAQ